MSKERLVECTCDDGNRCVDGGLEICDCVWEERNLLRAEVERLREDLEAFLLIRRWDKYWNGKTDEAPQTPSRQQVLRVKELTRGEDDD